MKIEIIKKCVAKTTQWSGGISTELYIYPENADLKKRDFIFRISTATVTLNESVFTALPCVARTLMVLEGELLLVHEAQHSKILKPFDQDSFRGDWLTKSYGKATDFNLMTMGAATGEVNIISIQENKKSLLLSTGNINAFYIYKGAIKFNNSVLEAGDTLVLTSGNTTENLVLNATEPTILVSAIVSLND